MKLQKGRLLGLREMLLKFHHVRITWPFIDITSPHPEFLILYY